MNPLPATRAAWRGAAAPGPILEVEVVCSDAAEHRLRVESRVPDLPGAVPPTWASVSQHHYERWTEPRLVIDTAVLNAEDAAALVCGEAAPLYRRR